MYIFITAHRATNTSKENDRDNKELLGQLKGFKLSTVLGCFHEEGEQFATIEETFKVNINIEDVPLITDLATKYNQDAVLLVDNNFKASLIYKSGDDEKIGLYKETTKEKAIKNVCYTIENNKYYIAS